VESYLQQREGIRSLQMGSQKLPKCEESLNGLSVSKMRGGALFWEWAGGEAQNVEGNARAKARCP
jgi:hypothetical protein